MKDLNEALGEHDERYRKARRWFIAAFIASVIGTVVIVYLLAFHVHSLQIRAERAESRCGPR